MIKFFRHIRKDLMEKNKTGKYLKYAIGEIVLVVIGILIALQINNWKEEQKEKIKEQAYLERLDQNLTNDSINIDLNIDFYKTVFEYGEVALAYAENQDKKNTSYWNILVAFFHSSQIWPYVAQSATFEELKSSGELSLIQSINLRNDLSYYYGSGLQRYRETMGINPPYRKMVRGLIPSNIQNYLWDNCHRTETDRQVLMSCEPNITESEARQIVEALANNDVLIQELRFYMSSIKVGLTTTNEQKKLCDKLIETINDQFQKRD